MTLKYDELMDKIEVTDAMRARILTRVSGAEQRKPAARRWALAAACFAVLLLGALTVPKLLTGDPAQKQPEQGVMIANGMEEVANAQALADAVGFPVSEAAVLPFEPTAVHYTSYWGQMAQITYEADDQSAELRKSPGTEENSGDWTEYPAAEQLTVGTLDVQLRGDAQDVYTLAVWTDGQYAYSLRLSQGQNAEVWQQIITGVQ